MKTIVSRVCLMAVALVTFAGPVFAMDLNTAKSQGLVGEMSNGLIGVVDGASGVDDLVKTVNEGRLKIYKQNAAEQNISVDQVQSIAGKKLQSATPEGMYVQGVNGKWMKK